MDKHKNQSAVRTTVAILAICVAVLMTALGFSATSVAEPLAEYTQIPAMRPVAAATREATS